MPPRYNQSEPIPKADYEVTRSGAKGQGVTAFLRQQAHSQPHQAALGAKSPASPLRRTEAPPPSSDELLLPDSAWVPEEQGLRSRRGENDAPAPRHGGLSKALTFRKGRSDSTRSPERKERRSLEETRNYGKTAEVRDHTSVNDKLKRFSLRSKPKEGLQHAEDSSMTGPSSKKGSLTAFFGVSESAGRVPHSPREPSSSKPPSIASTGSKNDGLPSLGEPAVNIASGGSSGDRSRSHASGPSKKDELLNVIKTLEGDYNKFHSKAMALRANIVRTTLLVFLKQYSAHPSNKRLAAEDLDRRASILNKWWIGLLDMLDTRNIQEVAGLDRPAIFEGISGIMERPEWRCAPSNFSPLAERMAYTPHIRTPSGASTASGGSEFILESVHHNIRNMFVHNIHSQMILVADRMSVRNAPASLVAFCGKCCAYAFFFCPGMADVLVRQWEIPAAAIKQVMSILDIRQESQLKLVSDSIASNFPRCLHSLKLMPSRHMIRKLQERPVVPSTANIPWQGFWESRWTGKESDLFYIFLKHYHILASEFLPSPPSKLERACVPGMVFICSQMLKNLNSTLHRQISHKKGGSHNDSPASFEDIIDAKATPFPTAMQMRNIPPNASRLMAENRFIMLLRDALEGRTTPCPAACLLFAESFTDVLKASVAATSLFNHDACFTLCDFLQEALVILVTFELNAALEVSLIDWAFWFKVLKRMSQSENTMTDIRLYALLFAIWPTLSTYGPWRVSLCLDFLLEEEYFADKFNHWCPMVRTYYMRLLCWRIARFDIEVDASDDDIEIFEALSSRLRYAWSNFRIASRNARVKGSAPYLTTPCNPAPNRRLIILRTEPPSMSNFTSLSSLVPSSLYDRSTGVIAKTPPTSWATGFSSGPSPSQVADTLMWDLELSPELAAKKKSRLFRSLLGVGPAETKLRSGADSMNSSRPSSRNASPERSLSAKSPRSSPMLGARSPRFVAEKSTQSPLMQALSPRLAAQANGLSPKTSGSSSKSRSGSDVSYTPGYFKFSLENIEKRPQTIPNDLLSSPPKLPSAAHTLLQSQLGPAEMSGKRPSGKHTNNVRYAGQALAEWALITLEHQHFLERRRNEGVPMSKLVETPTLSVDSFRKLV